MKSFFAVMTLTYSGRILDSVVLIELIVLVVLPTQSGECIIGIYFLILIFDVLTQLLAIFQLYHGDQF